MNNEYFEWLGGRSISGLTYRNTWLDPRLSYNSRVRILHVGCGVEGFLSYHPGTIGLDINPRLVYWCRRKGQNACLMEIGKLPFDQAPFYSVVLDSVLEYLSAPVWLLKAIHGVFGASDRHAIGVSGVRGYATDPDHKVFYDETCLDVVINADALENRKALYIPLKWEWFSARLGGLLGLGQSGLLSENAEISIGP